MTTPAISVNLVTYNHEDFIADAIRSVLDQTFADLELVIVDDGSTDRTPEIISSIHDTRIVSLRQANQGPSAATNRGLAACRGRYVALMSGDDLCHPDRLRRQLEEYSRGPTRVLFSGVDFIDDAGQPLSGGHFADRLFDTTSMTRAQILERFFMRNNFINAITTFTELRVLREAGPFNPLLFQLQDFDMWIRLVKRMDLAFMPESLVRYRIRSNQQNLSAPRLGVRIRTAHERYFVLRRFFDDLPLDPFRDAFRQYLINPECRTPVELACEQAFLFHRVNAQPHQLIGLEMLYRLLGDPESRDLLETRYGFTLHDFVAKLKEIDTFNIQVQDDLGRCENDIHNLTETLRAREAHLHGIVASRSWRLACAIRKAWSIFSRRAA